MKKFLILILAFSLNLQFAFAERTIESIEREISIKRDEFERHKSLACAQSDEECFNSRNANLQKLSDEISAFESEKASLAQSEQTKTETNSGTPNSAQQEQIIKWSQTISDAINAQRVAFSSDDMGGLTVLPGTPTFKMCQKALSASGVKQINEAYSGSNPSNIQQVKAVSNAFAGKIIKNKFDDIPSDPKKIVEFLKTEDFEETKKLIEVAFDQGTKQLRNCMMIFASIGENFEDKKYKEDDFRKPDTAHKSWDGRISCKLSGPETIDFDDCLNILNTYNGAKVVFEGNNAIQQIQAQDFMHEQQMKLMQTDPTKLDSSTAALESQKEGLQKQENMAETRRALLLAQIGILEGLVAQMPSNEDVINKCNSARFNGGKLEEVLLSVQNEYRNLLSGSGYEVIPPESGSSHCAEAFYQVTGQHDILSNQGVKTTVHAIAAEAGVNVVKESVAINALGKQQNMIDGVINKVKGAEVLDLPEGFTTQEELMRFCDLNPTAAECIGFGTGMTTHVGAGGGISMNGAFGTNTDDLNVDDASYVDSATDSDGKLTKADIPTSTVSGGIDKGAGFADGKANKAKITNAGFAGNGGSSGGGANAPGLSGGSGGPQAGEGGANGNGPTGTKLAYSGGGRSLSFSGGSGPGRKSDKAGGNPFADMLGKKGNGNDTINFRDLASKGLIGGKNGSIFDRISKKYVEMEEKDRLLKYNFVDKQ